MLEHAIVVYPADLDQDRALVLPFAGSVLLAVADGAGRTGGGAEAADGALSWLKDNAGRVVEAAPEELCGLLSELDGVLLDDPAAGETTLILARVQGSEIAGVSVGDSEAWLVGDGYVVLTEDQRRKPLLGSGEAFPVGFRAELGEGTRLLGTDGLFRYAQPVAICAAVRSRNLAELPGALRETVRLLSEALQDDLAVVVCRR